jgi:3-oxoadipate enol-lactonase
MTGQRRSTSARDGVTLAYEELGDGGDRTLVLLHSLGADRRMWEACAQALQDEHRILLPDTRGHGASGPAHRASVEQWVDDLEVVLDAAQADRVVLVGVSLGGIQALAFAAAHPGRVQGLVVADSFVGLPPETAGAKINNLRRQATQLPMSEVADRYVADTFQAPYPLGARAVREALAGIDRDSYVAAVEACFGVRIRDRLPHVDAPALVLWGDRDGKTPRHLSEQIADGLPAARLKVIPDAGHLSNIDNPDAFAAAVRTFTAECSAQPARHGAEGGI